MALVVASSIERRTPRHNGGWLSRVGAATRVGGMREQKEAHAMAPWAIGPVGSTL